MIRYGSPTVGGSMPATVTRTPRIHTPDERCTGCSRLSYVGGSGSRVHPLVDGLCPQCREGWACRGCGERHAFDELSTEMECGRCFVARIGKEAA